MSYETWQEHKEYLDGLSEKERLAEEIDDTINAIKVEHPDEHFRYFLAWDQPTGSQHDRDVWDAAQLIARYVPRRFRGDSRFICAVLARTKVVGEHGQMPSRAADAAGEKVSRDETWVPEEKRAIWLEGSDSTETFGALRKVAAYVADAKPLSPWLIWDRNLTLLVGRAKLGKSTLATADAVGALQNEQTVLWVRGLREEMRRHTIRRFADLSVNDDSELYIATEPPRSWSHLRAMIRDTGATVVYIDSLASVLTGMSITLPPTSDHMGWQALMSRFRDLSVKGGTCVMHHADKMRGDAIGSIGITAGVDTIITMKRVTGDPMLRKLNIEGRERFPTRTVRFLGETKGFEDAKLAEPSATVPKIKPLSEGDTKVLDALTDGMTFGDWFAAVDPSKTVAGKNRFNKARARLADRGYVTEVEGKYTRVEPIGTSP